MNEPATPPTRTFVQATPYDSPWTLRERMGMLVWEGLWTLLCAWTPKPLNPWRLLVLRCFGATLSGRPFVHSRARIQIPWHLTMEHRACLGDRAAAYTLGRVHLGEGATVAQEAYLCTGTHDFSQSSLPLQTAPIKVGANAFVGVRALVLPGVTIGDNAVVGGGAVVTRDVAPGKIVAGCPAKVIGDRATR